MIRRQLESWAQQAVQALLDRNVLPSGDYPAVEITEPKSAEHGDYACNFALASSKVAKKNPREVATALAEELKARPEIESVEIAGPGFINFRLSQAWLGGQLAEVLKLGPGRLREGERGFAFDQAEKPQRINVEYVSVNPNGPITIGSGRGAAFGDTLANVLQAAGHTVWREYYVNDGVNSEQMRLFAESVRALAKGEPVPENGYKGDYVQAVADKV
ncbi:MAG: arginine--tRNA ligase, partial [Fimbriimonadaceae bacterium]